MKLSRVIITGLFVCPLALLANDTTIETVGIAPKALFTLGDNFAIGALLEAGYEESYRGNLTLAYELTPHNRFKLGGEYLLQNQDIAFTYINNQQVWVDQYAGGLAYQFLPFLENSSLPLAFEVSGYYAYTPDKKVEDNARIKKKKTYGTAAGFAFELPTLTIVDAKARYDNTRFIYEYSNNETSEGLGFSGLITQPFGDRVNAQLGTDLANLYTNYYGGVNYLIPMKNMALELGVKGQATQGREGISDALAGFVTITLVGNAAPVQAGLLDQTLLDWTNQPAVYMPLVLAKADEQALSSTDETTGLASNIPDITLGIGNETFATASYFLGSPVSYSISSDDISGNAQINNSGVISCIGNNNVNPNPITATVTATYSNGVTVTSNSFTITTTFP